MPPEALQPDIRHRLLQAAGEVFAEFGYQNATVRDICARAGANIAAVNYHFGGKDELYAAVLEVHFAQTAVKYTVEEAPGITPEQQLELFIAGTVERMLNESKPEWHAKLAAREIAEPTPHLDTVAAKFMRPHFGLLRGIIDRLTPGVAEDRRRLLALSAMGQIVFYLMCREAIVRVAPEQGLSPADRPHIARHITETILATAKDLRERAARKDT